MIFVKRGERPESLKDVFNYAMLMSGSKENWNDAWNFD